MNIKTSDFDEKFDEVEDITTSLDFDKAHRPGLRAKRVNVDFPQWMSKSLDKEAPRSLCSTSGASFLSAGICVNWR